MDLFEKSGSKSSKQKSSLHEPLATRMRPRSLDEFVGQEQILGEEKLLRRMIQSGVIGSVIFYGPPSSGKTTLAFVISQEVNAEFVTLNAVLDGVKDLKKVVERARDMQKVNDKKTILFVDEIHRWNKAQQDALLPHLESGLLVLIGATTENPFYSLVGPLLSRCHLFELHPFTSDQLEVMIDTALTDEERGLGKYKVAIDDEARKFLAENAGGDIRNALNALELAVKTSKPGDKGERQISLDVAQQCFQKRTIKYDRSGDEHYHYASAFIKSMRGSDPDAALYWMTAMIEAGEDPNFVFRRMLIFASEDIGMADPAVLRFVNSAHEAFTKCGMPEGWYFLAHACIFCAIAPKSNSTSAVFSVMSEIRKNGIGSVPAHLRDKTANKLESRYLSKENASDDYQYPHNFERHWIEQLYLPEKMKGSEWYKAGLEGYEARYWQRLQSIRKGDKGKS